MSRQNVGKSRTETRAAPGNGRSPQTRANANRAAGQNSRSANPNIPVPSRRATQPGRAQTRPTQGRSAQAARPKRGFRLRPLDVALVLAGVLVVGFIVLSGLQAPPEAIDPNAGVSENAQHVQVGQSAPDFTVHDTDGKNYTLSDYKGKVVVLEFMATSCPHCQEETPVYNQLHDTYAGKGVEVFGINATTKGHDRTSPATINDLKWFRDTYHTTYTLLFDKALKSANDYGVLTYPSAYVVDKGGKIAFTPPADKLPTYDELAAKLDELLKQQ